MIEVTSQNEIKSYTTFRHSITIYNKVNLNVLTPSEKLVTFISSHKYNKIRVYSFCRQETTNIIQLLMSPNPKKSVILGHLHIFNA